MIGTSTEVGSIHWELDLDDSKFKSGMTSASAQGKKLSDDLESRNKKLTDGFNSTFSAISKTVVTGLTVASAAAVGFGITSAKAYGEAESANTMLEHAVIAVSKATKEQLQQTKDLADELERKGVLDGDNIKVGLAQLSTFGLSNKAVQGLGKSLADLAVNQFGVNASGQQLSDTANMIAKALNGQFGVLEKSGIRFTEAQKNMIQYGTEMEKVKAINEGFAQNLKYTNETALTDFDGKIAHIKVGLGNMQETIGGVIVTAITPLIDQLSAWASSPDVQQKVAEITQGMVDWVTNVAVPWIQLHWPEIKRVMQEAWDVLSGLVTFIMNNKEIFITLAAAMLAIKTVLVAQGVIQAVQTLSGSIAGIPASVAVGIAIDIGLIWKCVEAFKGLNGELNKLDNASKKEWWNKLSFGEKVVMWASGNMPHNAAGTDYWKGGLTWVGEQGAELVNLPRGSQIIPNDKAGGLGNINISIGNINNTENRTLDDISYRLARQIELARAGLK